MNSLKKARLLATVGLMLAPAAAMAAETSPHDVVKDARGNIVMNTFNNCVITQWPAAVEECGAPDMLRLTKEQRTVYFDFNKSTLNAKEKVKLDQLSRTITESKAVESVDVVGFADQIGTSAYNKTLSTKRAQTVRSYLATKGLKTRNIRVEGLGETHSVTSCDASAPRATYIACLAADRRVEIELNLVK